MFSETQISVENDSLPRLDKQNKWHAKQYTMLDDKLSHIIKELRQVTDNAI